MTKDETQKISFLMEDINELEKALTERISELHEVRGAQADRHSFCYYRKQLWDIKYSLRDMITRP